MEYTPTLRNSIYTVFQCLKAQTYKSIDFLGYPREDYSINFWPMSIQRVDGKAIPNDLWNLLSEMSLNQKYNFPNVGETCLKH